MIVCSCPLHDNRNGVDVCTCLCQEHDKFSSSEVALVREAVRRTERVMHDETKGVHDRLNAINRLYDEDRATLSRIFHRLSGVENGLTELDAKVRERLSPPDKATGPKVEDVEPPSFKPHITVQKRPTEAIIGPASPPVADIVETEESDADRIRLAKDALMSSGYFDEGQVDDEIAPRIHELIDAHNTGFLKMQDDLNKQINKWKDRAVVAERRMSSVRTFVSDNLRVTDDE